jgi:hypothetical protein
MAGVEIIPVGVHASCDIYRCQRKAKYAIGRESGSLRPYFKMCAECAGELAQAYKDSDDFAGIFNPPSDGNAEPRQETLVKAKPKGR